MCRGLLLAQATSEVRYKVCRPARRLIAARRGMENLRRNAVGRTPAPVKEVKNCKNDGIAQSHSGGERENDYSEHCERHYQG
jgi:hypothetical protein